MARTVKAQGFGIVGVAEAEAGIAGDSDAFGEESAVWESDGRCYLAKLRN
jgi:hypothetical protein